MKRKTDAEAKTSGVELTMDQQDLTDLIEALRDYQLRLEVEAANLARIGAMGWLAQERARQAQRVRALFEFFIHL